MSAHRGAIWTTALIFMVSAVFGAPAAFDIAHTDADGYRAGLPFDLAGQRGFDYEWPLP